MNIESTPRDSLRRRSAGAPEPANLVAAAEARPSRRWRRLVVSAGIAAAVALVLVAPAASRRIGEYPTSMASPAAVPPVTESPVTEPTIEAPDPGAVDDRGGENNMEEAALDAVDWAPALTGSRYNTFFVDVDEPAWQRSLLDTYVYVDRDGNQSRPETDSYMVSVWCGDQGGSAMVTLRSGDAEATTTARCGMTEAEVRAGVGEVLLVADSDHEIELKVELDEAAWDDGARPVLSIEAVPENLALSRR